VLSESPVSRAIREAIDAVAAPEVRSQILQRAQHMARVHVIPPSGDELQHFIANSLKASMEFYLGDEAASSVMKNLEPIVLLAEKLGPQGAAEVNRGEVTRRLGRHRKSSDARPGERGRTATRDEGSTHRRGTVSSEQMAMPLVVIASSNVQRRLEVEACIEGAATTQGAEDTVSFLDTLRATASMNPFIIVDCVHAAVPANTLATLTHELPESSSVLLWGASDGEHLELTELASRYEGWLRCGAEASPSDVAAIVQMVIGE
jgi:hypothetical protein